MIKSFINTFWGCCNKQGKNFLYENTEKKTGQIQFLISTFYFVVFILAVQSLSSFSQFPSWNELLAAEDLFMPLWSVKWISNVNWEMAVRTIIVGFLVTSFIALLFWKRSIWIRLIAFLFMFAYASLIFSFGKIDHYMHLAMLASAILIFLPTTFRWDEEDKRTVIRLFFSVQVLIFSTYFISGIFKIYAIFDQEFKGVNSALCADALGQNIAKTCFAYNSEYFLSDYIMNNSHWLFSLLLLSGYIIEALSIYVIFKPALHRLWGALLLLLHSVILMTVGPDFTVQMFVVGIFIFSSPFSKQLRFLS